LFAIAQVAHFLNHLQKEPVSEEGRKTLMKRLYSYRWNQQQEHLQGNAPRSFNTRVMGDGEVALTYGIRGDEESLVVIGVEDLNKLVTEGRTNEFRMVRKTPHNPEETRFYHMTHAAVLAKDSPQLVMGMIDFLVASDNKLNKTQAYGFPRGPVDFRYAPHLFPQK
jgi:hypothetical protein